MLVIDLETKKSFQEVGGRDKHHLLGISIAGVYDYQEDEYLALEEDELDKLENLIKKRDLLMGFNVEDFDWPVLQPYLRDVDLNKVKTLDLMNDIENAAGFRVALNNLAKNTLGEEKSGHGLEALEWFREGRVDEVKKYCLDDVRLTKDIYEYGKNHGVVRFESRTEGLKTIPAHWAHRDRDAKDIRGMLEEAYKQEKPVEIDYISSQERGGKRARKKRDIEIHSISGGTVEAFCHLRGDVRHFKIWRIISADIKESKRSRPTLF